MCLAVPGKLMSAEGDTPMTRTGRVDFGGVAREVSLAYVPEAKVGDYVIVHVGFALSVVNEEEAARTLAYFKEIGEIEESFGGGETSAGG